MEETPARSSTGHISVWERGTRLRWVCGGCLCVLIAGCIDARREPLSSRPAAVRPEADAGPSNAALRAENAALRERLRVLTGLPEVENGRLLHELERVRLTRYTGLYDRDDDGTAEALIVYLKPMDRQGDIVKAPARVVVQLWDLGEGADRSLVRTWTVDPQELAEDWFATLVTINYRLVFDLPESVRDRSDGLTVQVIFTDVLSGQVFRLQTPVQPR